MEQYEDFIVNEQNKPKPGSGKEYTVINSPLYTEHADKILYASDINWQDITANTGTGTSQTSTPFNSTIDVLNFINGNFNSVNEQIAELLNRIEALENDKQATVVSIAFDTAHMYDPNAEYFEGEKIIYTGETVKFSKPKVKLEFSNGDVEYITNPNDSRITWMGVTNPVSINSTEMANKNVIDESTPTDTSYHPVSPINHFNYHKFNASYSYTFWGATGSSHIHENLNPLEKDTNGNDVYRILDKFIHCKGGDSGLQSPEYEYLSHSYINTNLNNDTFNVNITEEPAYIKITNNDKSYDKYIQTIGILAQYNDKTVNLQSDNYNISNILLAPKKNITIHFNNKTYDFPLKAACEVNGNLTLSGQYDINNLDDTKYSELKPYINSKNEIIGNHALLGFKLKQQDDAQTLKDIFNNYNFNIDYIKKPYPEWYKRLHMNDSDWQNRPNSYYAYFDADEYNSSPTNIYAYMGNKIIFNYNQSLNPLFNNMPEYGYTFIGENSECTLPTVTGYTYFGGKAYIFNGWFADSSYTHVITNPYTPAANTILYGQFVEQTTPKYFSIGTEEVTASNYTTANHATTSIPTSEYTYTSTQRTYHYILIPSNKTLKIVDAADNTDIPITEQTNISIDGHKLYKTNGGLATGSTVKITLL